MTLQLSLILLRVRLDRELRAIEALLASGQVENEWMAEEMRAEARARLADPRGLEVMPMDVAGEKMRTARSGRPPLALEVAGTSYRTRAPMRTPVRRDRRPACTRARPRTRRTRRSASRAGPTADDGPGEPEPPLGGTKARSRSAGRPR